MVEQHDAESHELRQILAPRLAAAEAAHVQHDRRPLADRVVHEPDPVALELHCSFTCCARAARQNAVLENEREARNADQGARVEEPLTMTIPPRTMSSAPMTVPVVGF